MNLAIQAFVGPFQGCFKDGTDGTRDYRALSGGILAAVLFIVWFSVCVYSFIETNARDPVIYLQFAIGVIIISTVVFAGLRPYKSDIASQTGMTLSALMAFVCTLYITCIIYGIENAMAFVLVVITSIPHFVFYGYLIYRIRQCDFKRRLQEWCWCYRNSDNVALLHHD